MFRRQRSTPHPAPRPVLALLAIGAAACAAPQAPPPESAAGTTAASPAPVAVPVEVPELHHGIDVSGHSGTVSWAALKQAGHTFVFLKATEGVDLKDPSFERHWPAVKAAGLARGAYHFFVTEDDPEAQARFFIENVTLEPGDLAPVVDVELLGHGTDTAGLTDRLRTWLELVEEPVLPAGWNTWHLWQWKGDAQVPGVEKGADLSRVNRSGVDLTTLVVRR